MSTKPFTLDKRAYSGAPRIKRDGLRAVCEALSTLKHDRVLDARWEYNSARARQATRAAKRARTQALLDAI